MLTLETPIVSHYLYLLFLNLYAFVAKNHKIFEKSVDLNKPVLYNEEQLSKLPR